MVSMTRVALALSHYLAEAAPLSTAHESSKDLVHYLHLLAEEMARACAIAEVVEEPPNEGSR
jgi:hypothetical protein